MNPFQTIDIYVDGIKKKGKILKIVNKNNAEFAIYSLDNKEGSFDIFASKIMKDKDGADIFTDIESFEEKKEIIKHIKELFA